MNSVDRSLSAAPAHTVARLLALGSTALAAGTTVARLEAELLLGRELGWRRTELYAHPEKRIAPARADHYWTLVRRRAAGWPIAYLLGEREFWSLRFEVNRHTLIPRPETELLVERALELLPIETPWRIAEPGTGCGAVAAALAKERPRARILATDLCSEALRVARRNLHRLLPTAAVQFRQGDWLQPLRGQRFDLILSNPPYVRSEDVSLQQADLRFEPRLALDGGRDGLDALRALIADSLPLLKPGGWLLLEHDGSQGATLREWMKQHSYRNIRTDRDLAGWERVSAAQAPGD